MHYLKDVVTLSLDETACIGCGLCEIVCPHGVFAVENRTARIVQRDDCIECGACAVNCPVDAISVRAGVGCASGVIKGALRGGDACCGENTGCC